MFKIDKNILQELHPNFARIETKMEVLNKNRPLSGIAITKIKESLSVEWTYNSNSIEGNTLSLRETYMVLNDGITVGGKSLREHFETTNHHEAIAFLENLISPSYEISVTDILDIHAIMLSKIEKEFAGRLRNAGVRITGANFTPPNALKVSDLLDELIMATNNNKENYSTLVLATLFHHQFVHIHPFFDGNGRTVRLAMNLILMSKGYPPAIILANDRKKYYTALNQANNGNYQKLLLLMAQAVERSLDIYLSALPNNETEYKNIADIVEEEQLPYSQEYISLLARQGKIDAYKEGRNWVTSKEAIESYVKNRKRKR